MKYNKERFWERVKVGEDNECWNYLGILTEKKYGRLRVGNKMLRAHRVAWTLTHGEIPDGLCVLHHCDNPSCCNPKHLFLGTNADNTADMIRKGREWWNKNHSRMRKQPTVIKNRGNEWTIESI